DPESHAADSAGRAVEGVQIEILDEAGRPLPRGETGEVCYRTPGAMLGYWRNAQATARACTSDGWRRSGDLGRLDAEGYVQITGRIKDMVIRGGMNISAREVEELIEANPAVAAVAVFGVPDAKLGERVGAAVIPAGGASLTSDEVVRYLEERFQ